MIVPTKRLKQFISSYPDRGILCKQIDLDEATLSKLMNGERAASIRILEKFCRLTAWPMQDAWEIVDGDPQE